MSNRSCYNFSHNWFDKHIPRWEGMLANLRGQALQVLEIGAFEGACTTWLLDTLLTHPDAQLTSVDTFEGSVEHQVNAAKEDYNISGLEERFRANLARCEGRGKHILLKTPSRDSLAEMLIGKRQYFDLIYVDASYLAADVLSDGVLAWPLLREDGIMVFDDYQWDKYEAPYHNPRLAIDSFLACFAPSLKVLRIGYQVWLRKVADVNSPVARESGRT